MMPVKNNKNYDKKSLIGFIIPLFVICLLAFSKLSVLADGEGMVEPVYANDGSLYPVVDTADLLTDEQEEDLASRIYEIREKYSSDIVILTIDSLGRRSPMEYADDFYDYNNYGIGDDHDGIILLLSMENRDYWFGTTGSAISIYSDDDQSDIIDACRSYLSSNDYYNAFRVFISECEQELDDDYQSHIFTPGKFVVCLIIGLVLAFIVLLIFLAQLQTVEPASGASNYSVGKINLRRKEDRFLRSTISKTKIEKESSGSSTHTGSSGTSHGGSGGHF